jgi:site-specific DNA recombinase
VLTAQLKRLGITIKSVTEPISDTSTGRLMEHLLSAFAEFDNDVRSERTVAGMKAALEDGRWTFGVPLGYQRVSNARGRTTIEPDPARAPFLREAFELYARGTHTKVDVLRHVTALGLHSRTGKPLSLQTFQQILRNPICAGILTMPKWGIETVQGAFEPIVSRNLFDRVQDVLDGKKLAVTPHTRNHPDFPLRHFTRCGACGRPVTGSWSTGRAKRYAYYCCPAKGCRAVKARKDTFEGEFLDFLTGLRPRPEYLALFREIVLDVWNRKRAEHKATRMRLDQRIEALEERRQKLVEAYLYRREINEAVYRRQDDKLAEEIALARMAQHEQELDEIDVEGVLNFAERVILDARRLWIEGDLGQRQRLQKVLFPKGVIYDPAHGFGTAETGLFFRWLSVVRSEKSSEVSPTGFEPVLPA